MDEYINRNSFRAYILRKFCNDCAMRKNVNGKTVYALGDAPCRACEIEDLINYIEDYPAADVREKKKGKWIFNLENDLQSEPYVCSCCQAECWTEFYDFCPGCGAQMREVKPNE